MTKTRSTKTGATLGGLALATALIASAFVPHIAAAQSAPTADRVWAQCTLTSDAVTHLINSMTNSALGTPKQVAFVVIYSLEANDGQRLSEVADPEGPHTGPVLCRNTAVVPNIAQVQQTDNINNVDVLDVENAIILRYRAGSNVRKRYCHTVDANEDCFNLSP